MARAARNSKSALRSSPASGAAQAAAEVRVGKLK